MDKKLQQQFDQVNATLEEVQEKLNWVIQNFPFQFTEPQMQLAICKDLFNVHEMFREVRAELQNRMEKEFPLLYAKYWIKIDPRLPNLGGG